MKVEDGTPYRPSNGTEGSCFHAEFCDKCIHESEDDPCMILARTMAFGIDDEEYPEEWIYEDGSPTCTAFRHESEGEPEPTFNDPNQKSIFEAEI